MPLGCGSSSESSNGNILTKLRANDGAMLGTFAAARGYKPCRGLRAAGQRRHFSGKPTIMSQDQASRTRG
ncbi:hypothetical protein SBA6_300014 [Candidatus Sulfopaludibacter sp. SbA6]|nr:hypothetical protein SBA6_300014 [Candidatus Sulfopaludibacter sp. SbA6]